MSRRGSNSPSMRRASENSDRESSDEEDTAMPNEQQNNPAKSERGRSGRSDSKNDVDNSPDDSGSSRNSDADGSFVGKIRSNFSSMLNILLPVRQTKQEDGESPARQHTTERQSNVKNTLDEQQNQGQLHSALRKRRHSPNVAVSDEADSGYSRTYETVTKRPRLREAAESKQQTKSTRTASDTFRTLTAPPFPNVNRRLSGFLGNSVYRKRMQQQRVGFIHKTLFGSSHLRATNSGTNTDASSRRPSFNSSAARISKSLSTGWIPPEYGGSPFYEGLTRFGGASSARTLATHGPPRPTVTELVKKSHQPVKPPASLPGTLNETNVDKTAPAMSYSAQRILDIMEEYAAKSPASKRELIAESNKSLRTPTTLQMLNIIRMHEKERTEETTRNTPPPPPTVPLMEYTLPMHVDKPTSPTGRQDSKSAGGKQITKKTRLHADPIQEREETTVEPIQLPNLKLPPLIEGLPKFDFTVPMKGPLLPAGKEDGSKNAKRVNDDKEKQSENERNTSTAATIPESRTFKFTSPMVFGDSSQVANSDYAVPDLSASFAPEPSIPFLREVNKFVFAAPSLFSDLSQANTNPVAAVSPPEPSQRDEHTFVFALPVVLGSPSKPADEILAEASSFKFPDPKPLEEGTPDVPKVRSFKELMADSASKWACDVCMIRNEPHQQTCVACESPKPKPASSKPKEQLLPAAANIPSSGSFAAIVSAQSNRWECPSCSVRNDSTASVCVCCATEKPTKINSSGSFAAIVDAQSSKWECTACSVRNDSAVSVCVCCATEKPAKISTSASFAAIVSAQSKRWECPACSVQNDTTASACVCCATEKPAKTTNSGSFAAIVSAQSNRWECSACSVRNDPSASVCVCCATAKPTGITR